MTLLAELNRQSDRTRLKFQLPTEAQWEYACRAGTTTSRHCGDDETKLHEFAWFASDDTHPVGRLKPNPWGLHDMYGNVWEWCADWADFGADPYYAKSPIDDPAGPSSGVTHVHRGGCRYSSADYCRSALRLYIPNGEPEQDIGLRLAAIPLDINAREIRADQ